ncbi:MAG: tetratricopeptide repeat protein [Bacteroidales bacterium]|nr:tetratricopeptide repeat protein [Bacteroidales bacterium]
MKKIILLAAAALFASASIFAQDLNEATDIYNNGAMYLQSQDYNSALSSFQQALAIAQECGEEGEEMVANCKGVIPSIVLSIGKKEAADKQYDEAIAKIQEAAKIAEEYGNDEVVAQAAELVPGLRLQKANGLLQAKDFENAIPAYQEVLANDPDNGAAYLRLGSCYAATGKIDEAIEAYKTAYDKGETSAAKQLSTTYLKVAQNNLKAKKFQETIAACEQSNAYGENGNAYKLAASAATQLQKSADAITYYEKYLELSPNAQDANAITFTVAALYQQAGNKAKALEYYTKVQNDAKFGEQAQAQIKALQ